MVLLYLVDGAARGFSGWPGRLLSWAPLRYIGRISYGIYVLHALVAPCFYWLPIADTALNKTGVTVLLAMVSWHLFEKPINDLKRFFPYPSPPATEA